MATINLGAIKFNWKGPYNNGTAYAVDDVVSSGGSSYVCILASTGNAVSNGTYWQIMSSKGTDADLLNISSTAQGDIYYNNGSAIARLGAGTSGHFLKTQGTSANPVWADTGGGVLQIKRDHEVSGQGINSSLTWVATNLAVTITPTVSTSDFWIIGSISAGMDNHDSNASFNVHDSALGNDYNNTAQHIFTNQSSSGNNTNQGYMSNHWSTGADGSADDYKVQQSDIFGMYSPASNSASARTFTIVCRTHSTSANGININNVAESGDTAHMMRQTSAFEVWEIADGIYT